MNRKLLRITTLALVVLFSAAPAIACSIPVFRYALDRWPGDPFRIEAAPAILAQERIAADLAARDGVTLNIEAHPAVEAGGPSKVYFPVGRGTPFELWTGELTPQVYVQLTTSPARQEVIQRILQGHSAVFVFVESGQAEADDAAAKKLEAELTKVTQRAKLPVIKPDDPTSQLGPGPALAVRFSVLRIARSAANETFFIRMLAGPTGLDPLPANEPFVAPVFGRGRVLGAWPASYLTPERIEEACTFLLGACSCEAKDLNPGWDILLRVNWEAELAKLGPVALPGATSTAASIAPETLTITPAEVTPSSAAPAPVWQISAIGVIVLVAAAGLLLWRRSS